MSDKDAKTATASVNAYPMPDPNHVPVVFVNDVAGAGFLNGVINLTLSVARYTPLVDGSDTAVDIEVAARLRMDLACAQILKDTLEAILTTNTKPANTRAS